MKRKQIKIKSSNNSPNELWLYGKHPVFSAIQSQKREIHKIIVSKNSAIDLEKFIDKIKNSLDSKFYHKLVSNLEITDINKIDNLVGKNNLHQGLIANCSYLPINDQFTLLAELYKISEAEQELPNLLLLDQLSDPQNIGAIIRSAISFGITKIVFTKHNSPKENATMIKSSAGTIENAELFEVVNFSNLLEKLKELGYWSIGLEGTSKTQISNLKGYKNIALVVGSEGSGIRTLVKKNCDILAKIEISDKVESLNASVATAIALYELFGKN